MELSPAQLIYSTSVQHHQAHSFAIVISFFLWLEVLDNGSIQEFDRPISLLQIDGALNKMVQQLGPAEAAALLEAAKQVKFRAGKFATQAWLTSFSGSDDSHV